MLSDKDIEEILSNISFPNFKFYFGRKDETRYLQIHCDGKCNFSGQDLHWHGRKWMLSIYMIPNEIVQTAFKAVQAALEHEMREQFRYKDQTIFDPHLDVEYLVAIRKGMTDGGLVSRS